MGKFIKFKHNLSKVKNMWLFAMFDLPMNEQDERREYTRFRKKLLSKGFTMMQYSVYAKFCASRENAETYVNMVVRNLPPDGEVRTFMVTDKQFGQMNVHFGKIKQKTEKPPENILLF